MLDQAERRSLMILTARFYPLLPGLLCHFLFSPRGLLVGLLQDALQGHRSAAASLALVGGLHEREDLQRLLGADRRLPAAEELADLHDQRLVAAVTAARRNALAAEHKRPVA